MSTASTATPRTLGDELPGGRVRSIVLIAAGAALVGLSAQVVLPLSFTPVPLSLQTFAVLITSAALGSIRGVASMGLYVLVGAAGVGWFAQGHSGWQFASFGYVLGFVAASWLVGRLAERGADRTVLRTVGIMALGNATIYAFGLPWLMAFTHIGLAQGLALGVLPFLVGDAIKIAAASSLLPAAWKIVERRER
jgi:biotin transport system substrate-specific component